MPGDIFHMDPSSAEAFGVSNKDVVEVAVEFSGRDLVFGDVLVQVSPKYVLEIPTLIQMRPMPPRFVRETWVCCNGTTAATCLRASSEGLISESRSS